MSWVQYLMEKIKVYRVYLFLESKNFSVHISELYSTSKNNRRKWELLCSAFCKSQQQKKKPLEDGPVSPETAVLQANRSMGLTNENALHACIFFMQFPAALNPNIKTEILSVMNWIGHGFLPKERFLDSMLKRAYCIEQKLSSLPFGKGWRNFA